MKIAITGTHSVGKTTLIQDMEEHLIKNNSDLVVIKEVARELIKKGFKITPLTEYGIIHYIKEYLFLERYASGKIIFADRSLIDLYSYITVDQSPKIRRAYLELIREVFLLEKQYFDLYFYIPIEFSLTQDGSRSPDERYRAAVDRQIVAFMQQFGIKYVNIAGSRKKRLATAIKSLNLVA